MLNVAEYIVESTPIKLAIFFINAYDFKLSILSFVDSHVVLPHGIREINLL